jgi:hypothetical protein
VELGLVVAFVERAEAFNAILLCLLFPSVPSSETSLLAKCVKICQHYFDFLTTDYADDTDDPPSREATARQAKSE